MRIVFRFWLLLAALVPAIPLSRAQTAAAIPSIEPFDEVIVNGHIIDGTGSPWYSGQIGIRAGRIAAIGNLEADPRKQSTTRVIDAHGQVVAPGFIDMLGQSEMTMLVD